MVTAAMIAMFYLGTASGVIGAVLMSTSRSRDVTAALDEDATTELWRAA